MDATITPNRSLSRRGFIVLLAGLTAVNVGTATMFWMAGAWPIPVFLGLDVLGVLIAFRISYRGARVRERVTVSADEVRVRYETPLPGGRWGAKQVWASPTAFTAVALEDVGAHGSRVRLSLSGKRLTVGAALSPKERIDFGRALEAAVGRARGERWR